MKSITLHLPEPPSANRYWRHGKGRTYLSDEAKAYRLAVKAAYATQQGTFRIHFPEGDLAISLRWFRSRKDGDLDNRLKQALDALQGLAYTDDSQIVELQAFRADRPKQGGLTVHLTAMT